MTIEDAVQTLKEHGFLISQSNDGYWHYCGDLNGVYKEDCYASENNVKDVAKYLEYLWGWK